MVIPETVIIVSTVTEEDVAVFAIPHCLVSLPFVVVAVVAASTILCSSNGEVGLAEPTCGWSVTRTAWSLSAGIATKQLLHQGNPKLLHGLVWQVSEITAKNEAVGDYQIK